jgi:hypothetical protein
VALQLGCWRCCTARTATKLRPRWWAVLRWLRPQSPPPEPFLLRRCAAGYRWGVRWGRGAGLDQRPEVIRWEIVITMRRMPSPLSRASTWASRHHARRGLTGVSPTVPVGLAGRSVNRVGLWTLGLAARILRFVLDASHGETDPNRKLAVGDAGCVEMGKEGG